METTEQYEETGHHRFRNTTLSNEKNGTINENNLENSELKRLGVGRILDSLASLKDRKLILLNKDGSFSITELAREILWSNNIPAWARILRLLQIKSCSMEQITDMLGTRQDKTEEDIEKLRKNQLILMSPQRQEGKIVKIYEILSEGIEKIDETEEKGFGETNFWEIKPKIEILSIIDEITTEVQEIETEQPKKDSIITKLSKLKDKLEI